MRLFQVDSFTGDVFKGNPAGVCLLDRKVSDQWMRSLAAEMNLSETAFLLPEEGGYRLRWFTPTVEVPLCGHATLAAAHILWEKGIVAPNETLRFFTLSGVLTARKNAERMVLDFPSAPSQPVTPPADLLEALGISAAVQVNRTPGGFWLIEVPSEGIVRGLSPDFSRLSRVEADFIAVTSRGSGGRYDMVSRFFGPRIGINEDPVTGAAHCVLGPYWAEKLGKRDLNAYQASARGGEMTVSLQGDRCLLGGQAVTVFEAELSPSFPVT
jgi:PhzF family phenazine biosynthesis protein